MPILVASQVEQLIEEDSARTSEGMIGRNTRISVEKPFSCAQVAEVSTEAKAIHEEQAE